MNVSTTRAVGLQKSLDEDEDLCIMFYFVDPYSPVSSDGWQIPSSEFTAPKELGLGRVHSEGSRAVRDQACQFNLFSEFHDLPIKRREPYP